jgi:hypothetical protein
MRERQLEGGQREGIKKWEGVGRPSGDGERGQGVVYIIDMCTKRGLVENGGI